jgi:hypothetical protein
MGRVKPLPHSISGTDQCCLAWLWRRLASNGRLSKSWCNGFHDTVNPVTMIKWFVCVEIFTFTCLYHALLGHPWVISVEPPGDIISGTSDFIKCNDVNDRQDATTFSFINLFIQPYTFRATNSPILRSIFWLYIQFLVQCTDTAADRCYGATLAPVGSTVGVLYQKLYIQ